MTSVIVEDLDSSIQIIRENITIYFGICLGVYNAKLSSIHGHTGEKCVKVASVTLTF